MWETIIIQPFINILLLIYEYLGQNFGIAIILFTILIRLLTYPLTVKQIKSSRALQDMNQDPDWIKVQEKYKGNKEKMAEEQMKFYKEKGVSPFSSCLPTLLQFPLILGLYQSVIRAMAQTPMQMFDLTKLVYPNFFNASELLPLNNQLEDEGDEKRILGMTAPQRFMMSVMIFFMVVILGAFCLILSGKIVLPFF